MSWLVFGDPPHDGAQVPKVATALGVLALEVRGKLSFALPEPWLLLPDGGAARAKVEELRAAGASAVAAPAEDLARIPVAEPVTEFALETAAFSWYAGTLPWKEIRSALLYCEEPDADPDARRKEKDQLRDRERQSRKAHTAARIVGGVGGAALGAALGPGGFEHAPRAEPREVLELHGQSTNGPRRARIVKAEVSYDGLGVQKKPVKIQNWQTLLAEIAKRGVEIDRRGQKTKVRKVLVGGVGLAKHFEATPQLAEAFAGPGDTLGRFVAWQRS
jgi:hypothetical protein